MHARWWWRFAGYAWAPAGFAVAFTVLAEPPEAGPALDPPAPSRAGAPRPDPVDRPSVALQVTPGFARAAVRAALAAAREREAWARLASLDARAHTSALLPELILRVARNTDESLRLSPTVDEPYNYSAAGGAGWWLEGRLIWHFDRLLFDTHELGIERLRMEAGDRTGRLVNKVLTTLFAWQRAIARADDPKAVDEDRERAELARAEAEIMLDELTGGWFRAELARRGMNE